MPSEHAATTEITVRAHAAVRSDIHAAFAEESRIRACRQDGGELLHAPRDARIDLVEHVAALIHRIADRSCLDRSRIEVTEQDHVGRSPAEPLANVPALRGIHDDDEVGAGQLRGDEGGAVVGEVHAVAFRGGHRLGR